MKKGQPRPKGVEVSVAGDPVNRDREYTTVRDAASLVGVSEISIRRWLTKKVLRRYKCRGRTLIRLAELLALVKPA